ncbi:pyruvate ferredoxin oxidoreductase, gamma subunit [Thermosulfidibacter takaii ABI70S6]|uniref:Pyruvate ferredoxin oxidoreductase, gamma subunit n=1 Tax=Thermosulfidibacter takaii (strain DSM 17441 / JCM 13301 / NBRC 103674 / ABI70S6) TaxID=1298851 RepID=A0A0S3QTE4_THET7|nr:2-oxoacid:acceptor oxidoreductase family protein [Thermosulfidibacter takaii]BAT71569.1 pyruvate ferredoxin oxidoreductase, gamma subunit [Thermosulfidibacter takaii ABI70S6]
MIEIRIHGRGGQGAVVASRLLALSFFKEGKWVQSFPTFGAERRGAPVAAFTREDDERILLRCGITNPDILVVLDPTLLRDVDVTQGLKENGVVIVNAPDKVEIPYGKLFTVDATSIAVDLGLGTHTYPLVNTAMVGAFAGATKLVKLSSVISAIEEFVDSKVEENIEAAKKAYNEVRVWT